nr:hypothetical protein [uncultured Flavobacterium sp.]
MEKKIRINNIYKLGYILLLMIPLVQNQLRDYFRENNLPMGVILGSLPNFIAAFSLCSLGLLISDRLFNFKNVNLIFFLVIVVLIVYEIFQLEIKSLRFDYFDIMFTVIGGLTFKFFYGYILKANENKT